MRKGTFYLRSFRTKMVLVLFACIAGYLLFTLFMNSMLLKPYYVSMKERSLSENYQKIIEMDFSDYTTLEKLENLGENNNIRLMVVADTGGMFRRYYCSPGFSDTVMYQYNNEFLFAEWLLNEWEEEQNSDSNEKLFQEEPQFRMRSAPNLDAQYLNMYAKTVKTCFGGDYECYIIINTPVTAIDDGVSVANSFSLLVAICVLLIGGIVTLIVASRVVEPIERANETARKMSLLDFSERLVVESHDEIGQLANSINILSDQLEAKIKELSVTNSALKRELARKDKVDAMRREFISDVSHELKTPLAIIMSYCEGLQYSIGSGSGDSESEYYCTVIQDEAMRMSRLSMRLLNLAELESGEAEQIMTPFDLGELASERLGKLSMLLSERSIATSVDIETDAPVWADRDQIEEVVNNLLSNARNHTPDHGRVAVKVFDTGDRVQCTVFNSGSHIPEESLERIWDSFYKVDKARTRQYGGSGLGLKIVSTILSAHGAAYSVQNVEDGVMFGFALKKATPEQLAQFDDE